MDIVIIITFFYLINIFFITICKCIFHFNFFVIILIFYQNREIFFYYYSKKLKFQYNFQ